MPKNGIRAFGRVSPRWPALVMQVQKLPPLDYLGGICERLIYRANRFFGNWNWDVRLEVVYLPRLVFC